MAYEARKTSLRETFNKNLHSLVEDWQKTSSNTFVNSSGLRGFQQITKVTDLSRKSGGTRGTIRAKIELEVRSVPLTDFFVEQQRVSVGSVINEASVKRGKYKEKPAKTSTMVSTRAKILKAGKAKLVVVKGKKKTLSRAEGLKGFMYSPTNRANAKASTPLGVYVRLQAKTWDKGKRLPTYKIYAPPLAMLMLSRRVLSRIKFEQRIRRLYND